MSYLSNPIYAEDAAEDMRRVMAEGLPKTMRYDFQPYGAMVLGDLELKTREYDPGKFCFDLHGRVLEGSETSRLFHATSTRSIVGQSRVIFAVKGHEIQKGKAIRVAM